MMNNHCVYDTIKIVNKFMYYMGVNLKRTNAKKFKMTKFILREICRISRPRLQRGIA
jgi:hypothetical protein